MAFVLSRKPTFQFLVKVPVTNEKGGWDHVNVACEFKRRSQAELADLLKMDMKALTARVIGEEFVGWRPGEFKDADGTALEVNEANRTQLLAEPHVEAAIFKAWWESAVVGPAKN